MKSFTLVEKKQLSHDVFELMFHSEDSLVHQPGQFITFILDQIGGRSYSILSGGEDTCRFIIKRVAEGKKGSMYLCDLERGSELKGVGPVGKFLLSGKQNAKLFAGTGVGIVPLYNQIQSTLIAGNRSDILLLFGVRKKEDLFYIEELEALKVLYKNFDFKVALSREESGGYHHGYITELIDTYTSKRYAEAYLCGAPVVVDSMQTVLQKHNFEEEQIFTEKY